MPRNVRYIGLVLLATSAGCTEPTGHEPLVQHPLPSVVAADRLDGRQAARERLARRFALTLADRGFRDRLKRELDRSVAPESKLHLQRFLTGANRQALRDVARLNREQEATVAADLQSAVPLEVYFPVPRHRMTWSGGEDVLVATASRDHEPPVAFTVRGHRQILDPAVPPTTPVLAVVPVETDFDRVPGARILGGGPGAGPQQPPGLYMTYSHFTQDFEGWLKGSPEFEIHVLGQAGSSDSLTSYACAGEQAAGYQRFDQNGLDWSGNVLLFSQTQLNSYKAQHPSQNVRIFVVEDDDTACQIKTDAARFSNLIKAVEAAYPLLTGARDSVSGIEKYWKQANALQKLLRAFASVIKTNDELVGNAVEASLAGAYPNANWVVKGENNVTNGWINLVMR